MHKLIKVYENVGFNHLAAKNALNRSATFYYANLSLQNMLFLSDKKNK